MAALASAVIVSAPQAKTYADTQTDDTQAVTEKLIDDQIANAAQPAEQKNSETAANSDEKQNQQESSKLKSEKEINSKKAGFGSQALNHPAQATAVTGLGNEDLLLSEEKTPPAQGEGETGTKKADDKNLQKETDPNYAKDEKNVGEYRQSDLQPGDPNQELLATDERDEAGKRVEKDGFKFETKNPSAGSPNKKEWGYQITIDKETGQRTYTRITVTDGGRVPAKQAKNL